MTNWLDLAEPDHTNGNLSFDTPTKEDRRPLTTSNPSFDTPTEVDRTTFRPLLSACRAREADHRPAAPAQRPSRKDPEGSVSPYGTAQGDRPRTWTGRVVSLDEWRRLSDWERHGSTGQHFDGRAGRWIEGDAP
ncbi:hypothetical protein [Frigidibacter sp. MR17.24]|uniref:hypothetical protein n=1 Tax=Frigidibacter sp. MR17.24 TaxID=3127345 RepID=UPI003012BABF